MELLLIIDNHPYVYISMVFGIFCDLLIWKSRSNDCITFNIFIVTDDLNMLSAHTHTSQWNQHKQRRQKIPSLYLAAKRAAVMTLLEAPSLNHRKWRIHVINQSQASYQGWHKMGTVLLPCRMWLQMIFKRYKPAAVNSDEIVMIVWNSMIIQMQSIISWTLIPSFISVYVTSMKLQWLL